ncbi:MAG: glucose dehydrogenase [Chloroflexus sp.]|uniref:PQQ-dependent sugar dehydrogenase n=1 Tax=Chloroflexus sp. TaxID=1904827 RepID=UPI0021DE95AD|nr:PQQ-dependent sugar dehydrogenase [Chloroflexus sp.]GIV88692.1 MAG: glucose dehydrogenase [Chloroflexus sp.]
MRYTIWFIVLGTIALTACTVASNNPTAQPTLPPTAPVVTPTVSTPTVLATPVPIQPSVDPPTSTPTAAIDPTTLTYSLEKIADNFRRPTHLTNAGDGSRRLFVVEQEGQIWVIYDGQRLSEPFLDLRAQVGSRGNEQGLLSIAFHPQFANNGRFFVNYTDRNGDTVVAEYRVSTDPNRADPASGRELLRIAQPAANHNGGLLLFGPDGYLYIGTGDGGGAGDPLDAGQRLDTLLGKLLRIDVDNGQPYTIPADNPFLNRNGALPEIWAYGLRNPWRFTFDAVDNILFIADVGQNAWEEVNAVPANAAGLNYGWRLMEGEQCYRPATCDPSGLVMPVAVYPHDSAIGGCSVTGGEVYRGIRQPALIGVYFYADFCTGNLWALWRNTGEWRHALVARLNLQTTSFGLDEDGEIYLLDRAGGVYRLVAGD